MGRREFQFVEGNSSKFWAIELEGTEFTVNWGRIGTNGQTQTKSFDSEEEAKKQYEKLVAEKVKKGYEEVGAEEKEAEEEGEDAGTGAEAGGEGAAKVVVTAKDIEALEEELWVKMPAGYREYLLEHGEGILKTLVRIYPPWRIRAELGQWRARIKEYWVWDEGLLPKERALECIIVGDTLNGDEVVFHPGRPEKLFILGHEVDEVADGGKNIQEAIEALMALVEEDEEEEEEEEGNGQEFEPFDSREIQK